MRLGVSLAQSGRLADPAAIRSAATGAEQVGYSSVWVVDRLGGGRPDLSTMLDPLTVLTYAAAVHHPGAPRHQRARGALVPAGPPGPLADVARRAERRPAHRRPRPRRHPRRVRAPWACPSASWAAAWTTPSTCSRRRGVRLRRRHRADPRAGRRPHRHRAGAPAAPGPARRLDAARASTASPAAPTAGTRRACPSTCSPRCGPRSATWRPATGATRTPCSSSCGRRSTSGTSRSTATAPRTAAPSSRWPPTWPTPAGPGAHEVILGVDVRQLPRRGARPLRPRRRGVRRHRPRREPPDPTPHPQAHCPAGLPTRRACGVAAASHGGARRAGGPPLPGGGPPSSLRRGAGATRTSG